MSAETVLRSMPRKRRTDAEIAELDDRLFELVEPEHPVSVRRVFYAATVAGLVPKEEAGYKVVQREVLRLRRSGRMPYHWISDNTRWVVRPTTYRDANDAVQATARLYRRNLWDDQRADVRVFIEKESLLSVVDTVTWAWAVPLGIMRGSASETFVYEMARDIRESGQPTFVYQLGDHDPTGVMAWDNFVAKLRGFAPDADVTCERLAVTPEQIITMNLPTRPTKKTDSRAKKFTGDSVEVDAIPAPILRDLLQQRIESHVDGRQLEITKMAEAEDRAWMQAITPGGTR